MGISRSLTACVVGLLCWSAVPVQADAQTPRPRNHLTRLQVIQTSSSCEYRIQDPVTRQDVADQARFDSFNNGVVQVWTRGGIAHAMVEDDTTQTPAVSGVLAGTPKTAFVLSETTPIMFTVRSAHADSIETIHKVHLRCCTGVGTGGTCEGARDAQERATSQGALLIGPRERLAAGFIRPLPTGTAAPGVVWPADLKALGPLRGGGGPNMGVDP